MVRVAQIGKRKWLVFPGDLRKAKPRPCSTSRCAFSTRWMEAEPVFAVPMWMIAMRLRIARRSPAVMGGPIAAWDRTRKLCPEAPGFTRGLSDPAP